MSYKCGAQHSFWMQSSNAMESLHNPPNLMRFHSSTTLRVFIPHTISLIHYSSYVILLCEFALYYSESYNCITQPLNWGSCTLLLLSGTCRLWFFFLWRFFHVKYCVSIFFTTFLTIFISLICFHYAFTYLTSIITWINKNFVCPLQVKLIRL